MNAKRNALAAPFGQAGVSLARQLLLWLLLPQLVLWMAGGVATYRFAAGYANEAIDASLLQASRSLARQLKPIGHGLLIDFPRAAPDVLEDDPADKFRVHGELTARPVHFGQPVVASSACTLQQQRPGLEHAALLRRHHAGQWSRCTQHTCRSTLALGRLVFALWR